MKNFKNVILVIIAIVTTIGVVCTVRAASEPNYAPYDTYIPEGLHFSYVSYEVQEGESVRSIALEFMEEYPLIETFISFEHQVDEIIRVNNLKNPDKIYENAYLLIPVISDEEV